MDLDEKVCEICHDSESRWQLGRIYVTAADVSRLQALSTGAGPAWTPGGPAPSPLVLMPEPQYAVDLCDACYDGLEAARLTPPRRIG